MYNNNIRIGHTGLTHSHLMCKETESRCETCLCELTAKHIFLEFPTYQNARTQSNTINTTSLKENTSVINFIKLADLTSNI